MRLRFFASLVCSFIGCAPTTDTGKPPVAAAEDGDHDGYTAADDCDDADEAVHPGAVEVCNGTDDDCDGTVDGSSATDATAWYLDADADGYGDTTQALTACTAPDGHVADDTDCDDDAAAVHPGADELCNGLDDDCDGDVDEDSAVDAREWYQDADGDGHGEATILVVACDAMDGYVAAADDCDDGDAAIHPGAAEVCTDPTDYNCDGSVAFADADADGFAACEDCDDATASVNPDAPELCNAADDDCDGTVDEDSAADVATWYADGDGDGYGQGTAWVLSCAAPPGYAALAGDCDDATADVSPGAVETCDGRDDDCDGDIDEDDASDALTWYADTDADGFGDATNTQAACGQPEGFVATDTDCDDWNVAVYPGQTETCDEADEDCDGDIDEGATDGASWHVDADGDGFGGTGTTTACTQPTGYVADAADCDDASDRVYPGATETDCSDPTDYNCDGVGGSGLAYTDADGDGYGVSGTATYGCTAGPSVAAIDGDCDDSDVGISPAATEVCNGADDDCDGTIDADGLATFEPATGTVTDLGSTLVGATGAPAVLDLTESGTLRLCGGTYYLELTTIAALTIEGDGTTLDGGSAWRPITASGATLELADVSVVSGYVDGDGGCLSFTGSSLILQDTTFTGCRVADDLDSGGAVYSTAGAVSVIDSVFSSNRGAGAGGALYLGGAPTASIVGTEITGNRAIGTSFLRWDGYGGGVYHTGGTLRVEDSSLTGNVAGGSWEASYSYGGGIWSGGDVVIVDSELSGNDVSQGSSYEAWGGAVYANGDVTLERATITGNEAYGCMYARAGAGAVYAGSALTVTDSTVTGNVGSGWTSGGALYAASGTCTTSDVSSNTPVDAQSPAGTASLSACATGTMAW